LKPIFVMSREQCSRNLHADGATIEYESLVVAAGMRTSDYGHIEAKSEEVAPSSGSHGAA
jgi:NADH dehydrogenase FAD-containing subunit